MNHGTEHQAHCHASSSKQSLDWLLWGSIALLAPLYGVGAVNVQLELPYLPIGALGEQVFSLLNTMAWGIALGIVFVGVLGRIPREMVMSMLGRGGTTNGLFRATLAGLVLDLCSHGILMVGMRLYERGASVGQVMAFLIASPWNSFSLTLILWSLIGLWWTLGFIGLSLLIAIISGLIFEWLTRRGTLPANPTQASAPEGFAFWPEARKLLGEADYRPANLASIGYEGLLGARMVLRWIFFGTLLAVLIRVYVDPGTFQAWFGASLAGLGMTVVVATILEVCSEGSVPLAADLLTRAKAPGNAFAFLMTGVSTDYTEIMSLKDTTRSWKIALFLPLVTVPQVLAIAWLINITA